MEVAMEKITLSRNELYDLVWSEPIAALLKKYEISHSELIHFFLPDYIIKDTSVRLRTVKNNVNY